jgi:hypothetical protein
MLNAHRRGVRCPRWTEVPLVGSEINRFGWLCAQPAPRHPEPGRRRGLPAILPVEDEVTAPPAPAPTLIPVGQRSIDYFGPDAAAAFADGAMRNVHRMLG